MGGREIGAISCVRKVRLPSRRSRIASTPDSAISHLQAESFDSGLELVAFFNCSRTSRFDGIRISLRL
jgi:hypothetical protein